MPVPFFAEMPMASCGIRNPGAALSVLFTTVRRYCPGDEAADKEVRSRFGIIRRGGVQEVQQDAGAADGLLGAFDAHLLEPVLGLVQTRRIDEAEEHAVDVDALLYRVAGRAGDFGDHGTLVADQSVHEGAFSRRWAGRR